MPKLYTIGYERSAQPSVFQTLIYNDVQTLVDIREIPQSRKPGLSKTGLSLAAKDYGMQYVHMRALGTPRDIRYQRKIDHDQEAFRERYLEHLATQDAAMAELIQRIQTETCCLMCYEADAHICHRWFVAARAKEMFVGDLEVVHLTVEALTPQPPLP